jgi:hypothetical protein
MEMQSLVTCKQANKFVSSTTLCFSEINGVINTYIVVIRSDVVLFFQTIQGLNADCSQSFSQIVLRPGQLADQFDLYAHKNSNCGGSLELSNLVVCGCQRKQFPVVAY